jgi:hypothetical protein
MITPGHASPSEKAKSTRSKKKRKNRYRARPQIRCAARNRTGPNSQVRSAAITSIKGELGLYVSVA